MQAARLLYTGDFARKEISMAKVQVTDALHKAVDTAIQLNGARGYSKDTVLEWMYLRPPGAARGRRVRGPQDGSGWFWRGSSSPKDGPSGDRFF